MSEASHSNIEIDQILRERLSEALGETGGAEAALGNPETNLFDLGLDSLRAFSVLEELAAHGVEVDFLDFTENPTVAYLRAAAKEG